MTKYLLFSSILLILCTDHYAVAMESLANNTILIDNGLLTECGWKTIKIKYFDSSMNKVHSNKIKKTNVTLINLIKYKTEENYKNFYIIKGFLPIVYKEINNKIYDLGLFDRKVHKEAIEAIRQNKALYCSTGQGAFIYNIKKQPNPDDHKDINGLILTNTHIASCNPTPQKWIY